MTSTFEGDSPIPFRVAFDDDTPSIKKRKKVKATKEDGIEPFHKKEPEVEDKKKVKEKEHKKKKDKSKEKKEKVNAEKSEMKSEAQELPPSNIVQPEKDIGDKPSVIAEMDKKQNENAEVIVPGVPIGSTNTIQSEVSESEPKETRKASLKKRKESKQEMRENEDSDRKVIRAATRRDFYEDRTEPENRRSSDRKESNSNIKISKRQERYSGRDLCERSDMVRDACTTTRDGLFGPCQFLVGPKKESCRDLCERRKHEESRAGNCEIGNWKGLDKWCDDRCFGNEITGPGRENRGKGMAAFNTLDAGSTGSIDKRGRGAEGRGDDWKGRDGKPSKEGSTDEMTQLKNDLTNLQDELDRLKECLRAAAIAAEKNKCTITKMKEHIRCNFPYCFPDFARIREKLKNCHMMKMKLCREFRITPNRDRWRKDFECLMNELNTIKFELEKMRKDKS